MVINSLSSGFLFNSASELEHPVGKVYNYFQSEEATEGNDLHIYTSHRIMKICVFQGEMRQEDRAQPTLSGRAECDGAFL